MIPHPPCSRRAFLAAVAGGTGSAFSADEKPLVQSIERQVIFNGRKTRTTWFHPRGCVVPRRAGPVVLMTLQTISGSDVFGPVHWTESNDRGATWSKPGPIAGLGRRDLGDRWEEGVCDVVPEYHPRSDTVLAIGHNVFYHKGVLARPQRPRCPVYVVRTTDGTWLAPKKLTWDDPRGRFIYTCNCAQRITRDDGDVLIPLSFGARDGQARSVATVLCGFDGKQLSIRKVSNELAGRVGRGFLEPSLARLDGRCYLTIRAEDGRGYASTSADGLEWEPVREWKWDDGKPIEMSTTQQRWLVHSAALFLVYTRKDASNAKVIRWRAPLYLAEVDRKTMRLIRATERIVFPLLGDAVKAPRQVALTGNFHTTAIAPRESIVTVGENRPADRYVGDTLLARIRWIRENGLAPR